MRGKYRPHHILEVVLLVIALAGFSASNSKANENSKYLDAVREFADNVLKYGRDTYVPKHTPLFVDGLNIHTHEPVEWISKDGEKWILSNLASQQTLMRTLDGLSAITGNPKYHQAAVEAIEYAFEHLRTPNGLLYWGHCAAYDARADDICGYEDRAHALKLDYPYYELMWEVDPEATKKFIESFWSAHIIDWSNLDFNRGAFPNEQLEEPWNHKYDEKGSTFFKGRGHGQFSTGSSLIHAGSTLYNLSEQEQPLIWCERLAKRYVDTRHPNTGISAFLYNGNWHRPGDEFKKHFVDPHTDLFPYDFFEQRAFYYPEKTHAHPWVSFLLVGEMLEEKGKKFTQWALEELTAWGKISYRRKDNVFIPMLTDGTSLEGYVFKQHNALCPKSTVVQLYSADLMFFWAYTLAYRTTGDEYMWQMARDIGLGNGLGDIGENPKHKPKLRVNTNCSDVFGLIGLLELYNKTNNPELLQIARRIGDNILQDHYFKGFFVPSKKHIYTRFDCFEPLALLHLVTTMKSESVSVPRVWPSCPLFVPPYRYKQKPADRQIIYSLTDSLEPPMSLQEAAAIGDVNMVSSLLEKGADVDGREDQLFKTALHRAAIGGHTKVVELLLAKKADVDAMDSYAASALHYAAREGHNKIAILLIATGADVNARDKQGRTPIDLAVNQDQKEIVKLLLSKSGDVSLHTAAYIGDLQRVEIFIANGADVDAKDQKGQTALHYAAKAGQIAVAKLLIANGADVNAGEWTPLQEAAYYSREMVELLLAKGANINTGKWTALHSALDAERFDIVELLLAKGADANIRDDKGRTPLHIAAWYAASKNPKIVELLLSKGADINAKDKNGKTALSYATENGHTEIAKLLRKHGAKE